MAYIFEVLQGRRRHRSSSRFSRAAEGTDLLLGSPGPPKAQIFFSVLQGRRRHRSSSWFSRAAEGADLLLGSSGP
jgi:hypothetical protein